METRSFLITLFLLHTTVDAGHKDQTACLDLNPIPVNNDLDAITGKMWWMYAGTSGHRTSTKESPHILFSLTNQPGDPATTAVNLFVYYPEDQEEGNEIIVNRAERYTQIDPIYAVYKIETLGMTYRYRDESSVIATEEELLAEKKRSNGKVRLRKIDDTEIALIHAEKKFLIYKACRGRDAWVQIAKDIVDYKQEKLWHLRIIKKLQELKISPENLFFPERSFPFPVDYKPSKTYINVRAENVDQKECLNSHPLKVTRQLKSLIGRMWWTYGGSKEAYSKEASFFDLMDIPDDEPENTGVTIFIYDENKPDARNHPDNPSILSTYGRFVQVDPIYAVYYIEPLEMRMFKKCGSSIPVRKEAISLLKKDLKEIEQFALLHAEPEFLIYKNCVTGDAWIKILKDVVDHKEESQYRERIMEVWNNLGEKELFYSKTFFPFKLNYKKKYTYHI